MKISLFFISVLTFSVLNRLMKTEACNCPIIHPQVAYCNADFVIIAKVIKATNLPNNRDVAYSLSDVQKLKVEEVATEVIKAAKILTTTSSSTCGVNLIVGRTYIMTGIIVNKNARINSCGYIEQWASVPTFQKRAFKTMYKNACDCMIDTCNSRDSCKITPPDYACIMDLRRFKCYSEFTACQPDSDEICEWMKREEFAECLAEPEETEEESEGRGEDYYYYDY